jgi:hypothetical protein
MRPVKIVSTRFTNVTLKENRDYRCKAESPPCIYASPQTISPKILFDCLLFVVEMNNDLNRIEGIGLIRNRPYMDKYYKIHNDANYNRYIYKSQYFIERDILLRQNPFLVEVLDYILFKEKTHLKRGCGFTTIPEKLLKHIKCENINIVEEIRSQFINIFGKTDANEEEMV